MHECAKCNQAIQSGPTGEKAVDLANAAVCQLASADKDPDQQNKHEVLFNLGLLKPGLQKWGDGEVPGKGVTLTYEGGSSRGGCGNIESDRRSTEIVVTCDPCNSHNISKVTEPSKCHYRVEISSYAGCATNRQPPSASCPHICDQSTLTCKSVPAGTPDANATLGDCTKTCTKVPPPPPPPPLSKNPCIRFGHAVPVAHHVDVQITQVGPPAINHTWTNFKFADVRAPMTSICILTGDYDCS
eukprot:COSAG02_NODE_5774_length_4048_cov_1.961509_3_plen_243_part_00